MPKPVIAYPDRARLFFRRLAEPSNAEFTAAMKRTADALSPFRRREPTLLPDADSELRHLDELLGSRIQLRRAISSIIDGDKLSCHSSSVWRIFDEQASAFSNTDAPL